MLDPAPADTTLRFPCTITRGTALVTGGVIVVLLAVFGCQAALVPWEEVPVWGRVAALAGAVLMADVLTLTWALAPARYEVTPDSIRVVRRAWKSLVIPRDRVAEVRELQPDELRGTLRLFGSGGFFGVFGIFWNKPLGRFRMHGTRMANAVLLRRTEGMPVVLTPDDPDGFVREARKPAAR